MQMEGYLQGVLARRELRCNMSENETAIFIAGWLLVVAMILLSVII